MKKILVVDNDRFMLEFMTDILSKEGHEVLTAEDGLFALDILKDYTPDVIFTDIIMPKIDGKKLCSIIGKMPKLKDTHVVILSAVAFDDEIHIDELGAHARIAKGSLEDMISSVQDFLKQSEISVSRDESDDKDSANSFFKGVTRELFSIKKHFEDILNQISEGMIEMTSSGRIIYANPSAIALVGVPEERLLGAHFVELLDEKDAETAAEFFEDKRNQRQQAERDCQLSLNQRQVVLNGLPLGGDRSTLLVILNDVSDRKLAEKALLESERMKGVLEMAGAVCHELNQPLQSIMWYFELLRSELGTEDPKHLKVQKIEEQIERIATITKKLSNITIYETKKYLHGDIIDIDKASRLK